MKKMSQNNYSHCYRKAENEGLNSRRWSKESSYSSNPLRVDYKWRADKGVNGMLVYKKRYE